MKRQKTDEGDAIYLPREQGQGLVEYVLILVLTSIVVIFILALVGPQIARIFSRVTSGLGIHIAPSPTPDD